MIGLPEMILFTAFFIIAPPVIIAWAILKAARMLREGRRDE